MRSSSGQLNSGLLSGAYTHETTFPHHDERSEYFSGRAFVERIETLQDIQRDLQVANATLLEYSLRYILSNPHVSVVIPGASTVGQLTRYIAAGEMPRFSESELAKIRDKVFRRMNSIGQVF
jgi:aryl-alcohol dehydrogenase-like predicted oxidoreductase